MALKPATTVIPADTYTYTVVQVEAKTEFGKDGLQKQSPEGVPLWTVDALRHGPDGAALVSVTVPASTQPNFSGSATFENLRSGMWFGDRPKQGGLFWQADSVAPANQSRRSSSE